MIESVVSVAVKTGVPTVEEVTAKVTTPFTDDIPDAAEIVSVAPRLELRVTVLPETGFKFASLSVLVTVAEEDPLATKLAGLADTVETKAETLPGMTWRVGKREVTVPPFTVAERVAGVPDVIPVRVAVYEPSPRSFTVDIATVLVPAPRLKVTD